MYPSPVTFCGEIDGVACLCKDPTVSPNLREEMQNKTWQYSMSQTDIALQKKEFSACLPFSHFDRLKSTDTDLNVFPKLYIVIIAIKFWSVQNFNGFMLLRD